ncbi:MAG TPA: aldehyde ferredoxin oxidoreductase family protein, partial [Anaerolineae bacterium]|nr:aldehyde ferredoxin oxidoreductase family protein [Anaerolineae bacterium]
PPAPPLSAENALAISAGPLGGTTFPGTGRVSLAARSPLTGLWGEASLGGYFGTQLKRAGYDALIVRGMSPQPVILVIDENDVRLEPAGDLWGQETYDTERTLRARYPNSRVITIGPAGERCAPMASLVHQEGNDVAARCGLGAVAGSKQLKAIVARGAQSVPLADEKAFNALKRQALKLFSQNGFLMGIQRGRGTAGMTSVSIELGDLPSRNWQLHPHEWLEYAEKITGDAMHEMFPPEKDTCYACPVACKWLVNAPRLDGTTGHLAGVEYESLAGLGSQTQSSDALAILQTGDLCNRLGIDTISAGATIAWAIEAYEKGILTQAHTDGLALEWGNPALVLELVQRMSENRPGIGALLAQGSRRAAEQIGGGAEFAIQVKGLELPFHHPRALRGLEIAYATLPRGASHNEEGAVNDHDHSYESWIGDIIHAMDLSGANSSMVYCQFLAGALNEDYTAQLLTAATGVTYSPEDLQRVGERTWYLRRAFNARLGVGREADGLPRRVVEQIQASGAPLADFDRALNEFFRQRELDESGTPSPSTLQAFGLLLNPSR